MKNKILSVVLMLLFSIPAFGQLDRSVRPKPGPAPVIKLGHYDTFKLDNGLTVIVVENHKLPVVSFSLRLKYDPILEGNSAGYVNLAGQLLGTATKNRTKDQINEQVDFIGATLLPSATGIYASSLTKHTDKLLDIMSDVLLNPVFKQTELDRLKKQTESALKAAKDNPNAIARNVMNALVYGKKYPYGEMTTEKSVKSITLNESRNFYNTYFHPNIAYLAIVGDITKDKAQNLAEKYFGQWKKKDVPVHKYKTPEEPLIRKVAFVNRESSVQSVINIAYPIKLALGTQDAITGTVVNKILGGGATGRLFQNLREDKAYTYGAYSSISADEFVGKFDASSEVRNAVTDSAITQLLYEMERIGKDKVTTAELNAAKNFLTGQFGRSLERPQTLARYALNIEMYKFPKDYYRNYLKNLSTVTVNDVQKFAKKYVKPNNSYVIVVGNAGAVAKKLKKFSADKTVNYYDVNAEKYNPSAKKIPAGITAMSVLNSYIKAIGGEKKLLAVKDRKTVMKGKIQRFDFTLTIIQKAPNKYHSLMDAGVMKQTQVFDGTKGNTSAGGQSRAMTPKQIQNMKISAMLFSVFAYKKDDVKKKLTGMEKINGKDTYKLALTFPSGKKVTQYYNVDNGLRVKEMTSLKTPRGSFLQTTEYSNYKEVDGIKYPFKISQQMGPQNITMTVTSVEVNKGVKDSIFKVK